MITSSCIQTFFPMILDKLLLFFMTFFYCYCTDSVIWPRLLFFRSISLLSTLTIHKYSGLQFGCCSLLQLSFKIKQMLIKESVVGTCKFENTKNNHSKNLCIYPAPRVGSHLFPQFSILGVTQ